MQTVILIFHVLACFALILIVLLQTGRGAEMGAAFGGSSQTLFGSTGGSTFFSKLTTVAAIVFMLTCLGLTYFSDKSETKSIMEKVKVEEKQGPVIPEAKPVQASPPESAEPGPVPEAAKAAASPATAQGAASTAPAASKGSSETAGSAQTTQPPPASPGKSQ
jgi:preprotein translocase subunit SecG